ncbi:MAG: hypothetical protein IKR76_05065, partial [Ruminococcus sp.]|nr:hypothetical protein [Ruminococcus sp.]
MDRFESIIESLGSFLGAFMGLLMLGGIIAVIIIIIRNSKKPRYEQLKQQAYQQQAQQNNNPYGQGQPYPQQGQPYPQGQPYQQGQPYPQQGMPYPQGQPYPQGMPYPPQQPQNNNTAIKAVIIGLVLYFFVLPLITVIVIMGMIFGMARSCDRDHQQLYDEAISSSKLSVKADTPKTIEAGSTTLTKFLDSNYSFIGFAGDYLVLQNDAASHTSYGFQQGCRVLVDKEGELVTPDDEYYSTITLTDK